MTKDTTKDLVAFLIRRAMDYLPANELDPILKAVETAVREHSLPKAAKVGLYLYAGDALIQAIPILASAGAALELAEAGGADLDGEFAAKFVEMLTEVKAKAEKNVPLKVDPPFSI